MQVFIPVFDLAGIHPKKGLFLAQMNIIVDISVEPEMQCY